MLTGALLKFLGLFWFLRAMGGRQNGGAPPSSAAVPVGPAATRLAPGGSVWQRPPPVSVLPATPSWPSSPPGTLPPFPAGWEYDNPVPVEVQRRASALLSQLWATGVNSYVTEMTGGRWITYRAEVVAGGSKGVTAWRVKGGQTAPASPQAAPGTPPDMVLPPLVVNVPSASPGAASMQQTQTPLQTAAVLMNNALGDRGYRKSDQPLYRAFQRAAGLGSDGFPGRGTMSALTRTLAGMGVATAAVPVYPWSSRGAYDGKNAPPAAQWNS